MTVSALTSCLLDRKVPRFSARVLASTEPGLDSDLLNHVGSLLGERVRPIAEDGEQALRAVGVYFLRGRHCTAMAGR